MPAATTAKKVAPRRLVLDCSTPVSDNIFDAAAFEKYLHDRIKVENRTNNLAGNVLINRTESGKIILTVKSDFSKRYLKYLSKKYLKKNHLRDWLRVTSVGINSYQFKYYNINQTAGDSEESDEE
ncbi:60S ribosomal protein L22 [Dispira simplex]|nr:60S ribosomal protein L22 [Dispira simplex]